MANSTNVPSIRATADLTSRCIVTVEAVTDELRADIVGLSVNQPSARYVIVLRNARGVRMGLVNRFAVEDAELPGLIAHARAAAARDGRDFGGAAHALGLFYAASPAGYNVDRLAA